MCRGATISICTRHADLSTMRAIAALLAALVCASVTLESEALRFLPPQTSSLGWPLHFDTVDDALRSNPFFQTLREALKASPHAANGIDPCAPSLLSHHVLTRLIAHALGEARDQHSRHIGSGPASELPPALFRASLSALSAPACMPPAGHRPP